MKTTTIKIKGRGLSSITTIVTPRPQTSRPAASPPIGLPLKTYQNQTQMDGSTAHQIINI